jgi:hypothetical protein
VFLGPKRYIIINFFFSLSLVYLVIVCFAVITQHHSTHLSCYPVSPIFFFFFVFVKNQKFIYWVGSLYTQFSFQEEEKTKQFRFIGFASLHITVVLLYIIFVQHYLMCVFLFCGWCMYRREAKHIF